MAFGILLTSVGCVDPYVLPSTKGLSDLLVVDGLLQDNGNAMVKLSRSISLDDVRAFPPEQMATVSITDDAGATWNLTETAPGEYTSVGLPVTKGKQYRLIIHSANGQDVSSKPVTLKDTPPISSLDWEADAEGIRIYASSSDVSGDSRFYKWEYTETWEYTSAYISYLKFNFGQFEDRRPEEFIYRCYQTVNSLDLTLSSTLRLQQDLTTRQPIIFIPKGSQKLAHLYSINVSERSLSREEYDYWSGLERTTEKVGGLFDALPSQVVGNLTGSDGSVVLGYFSASTVSTRRLFIDKNELPTDLLIPQKFPDCLLMNVTDVIWSPTTVLLIAGSSRVGFTYSSAECVDCRIQGGVTKKPDFWPN